MGLEVEGWFLWMRVRIGSEVGSGVCSEGRSGESEDIGVEGLSEFGGIGA